ncbi:MAG TPA: DUF1289 domain-containing protein [Methylophilus sp.]
MSEIEVQSPCIGVCTIDDSTGFCQGCFRTLEEIQGWWDLENTAKAAIVKTAAEREAAAFD